MITSSRRNHATSSESDLLFCLFKTSFNIFWMQSDDVLLRCSGKEINCIFLGGLKKYTNFCVKMVKVSLVLSTNSPKDFKLTMILNNKSSQGTRADWSWSGALVTSPVWHFYLKLRRGTVGLFWTLFSKEFTDPLLLNCRVVFTSTNIRLSSQEHLRNQWNRVLFQFLWKIKMMRSFHPVI